MIIRKYRKQALSTRKTSIKILAQKELQVIAHNFRQNNYQKNNSQQNKSQQKENALNTLKQLSIFLRRYVLSLTARENVAALTDGKWVEYLDRLYAENPSKQNLFSKHYANLLQEGPYQKTVDQENTALIEQLITDLEQLLSESEQPSENNQLTNNQFSKNELLSENHNMSVTTHKTDQKTDSQSGSPSPEMKSPEVKSPEVKSPEIKSPEAKSPEVEHV